MHASSKWKFGRNSFSILLRLRLWLCDRNPDLHVNVLKLQARSSCSNPNFAEVTEKLVFGCKTYSGVRKVESLMDLGISVDSWIS